MARAVLAALLCAALKLNPATAQSACLTFSETLRCFNEANNVTATSAKVDAGETAGLSDAPLPVNAPKCVRSRSVFVSHDGSASCE